MSFFEMLYLYTMIMGMLYMAFILIITMIELNARKRKEI